MKDNGPIILQSDPQFGFVWYSFSDDWIQVLHLRQELSQTSLEPLVWLVRLLCHVISFWGSIFLLFGTWCSRLIIYLFSACPGISHFSKHPWIPSWRAFSTHLDWILLIHCPFPCGNQPHLVGFTTDAMPYSPCLGSCPKLLPPPHPWTMLSWPHSGRAWMPAHWIVQDGEAYNRIFMLHVFLY